AGRVHLPDGDARAVAVAHGFPARDRAAARRGSRPRLQRPGRRHRKLGRSGSARRRTHLLRPAADHHGDPGEPDVRRFALLTALVAVSAACTPVRTTLPPPYPVDGRTFDTTEQLAEYAERRCREASGGELPPNRFTTDGCSVWPDGRKKPDEGWLTCCISHDVAYWCGAGIRRDADQAFRACLRERSSAANANVMYT